MNGRYHVDTPAQLDLVRIALDKAFGLRDAAGAPTPRPHWIPALGRWADEVGAPCYTLPGQHWPLIDGGDGTAAIRIAQAIDSRIDDVLGTTVGGTPIPSVGALVQVTRARDHSQLPTGVRDVLDDGYVDGEWALIGNVHANENAARAAVIAELQGARATAALARKDARGAQAALERAMGIGRSQ